MPTIKDIAREAGVSHGTVSNVINGRGNVSVEKMRLVWEAAEKLGYKINDKARSLRQGENHAIAVLLPDLAYNHCSAMFKVFQSECMLRRYTVQLYATQSLETQERALLTEALNTRVSAVIAQSCIPDAAAVYRAEAPDIPIVLIQYARTGLPDIMSAGFELQASCRDIGRYLLERNAAAVGVLTDSSTLPDTALWMSGLMAALENTAVFVRWLDAPNHQIDLRAFELFESDAAYDYIICTDQLREQAVRKACAYASSRPLPQIITIAPRTAVIQPEQPVYELDYKHLARQIILQLMDRLQRQKPLPEQLIIKNSGFRQHRSTISAGPAPHRKRTLSLLTMASPSTAALSRLLPHLRKSTGIDLKLTVLPSLRDVYRRIRNPDQRPYDLIRIDVAWMDELAGQLFRPLDEIDFNWDQLLSAVMPEFQTHYTAVQGRRYTMPYDPSTQLLFYRRDLFNNPTYKRMYYETYRRELRVPRTFADYNQIARFFTRSLNQASPVPYGTTAAIGNVVVSPSEFFPRLLEENAGLLNDRGQIVLNTPAAARALANYQETYAYSDRTVHDIWEDALESFADGSAAMTMVFINYASHILNLQMSSIAGKLGVAPVPGGRPLMGGGVIGITKACRQPDTAAAFFDWLYADLIAPVFTMLGGLSPCQSAYGNRDVLEHYPWLSAARKSFSCAYRRGNSTYYENFSELRLESILAAHIQTAVLTGTDAFDALNKAQAACDAYFIPRSHPAAR